MGLFFFVLIALLPFIIERIIKVKFMFLDALNSKETTLAYKNNIACQEKIFDRKWGSLYKGFKKDKMSINHNFIFIIRRQLFVMVIYWIDFPAVQIIGLVLTN